jgi:integrase/recombinase XerC
MELAVVRRGSGHRLVGDGPVTEVANGFLEHLETRGFAQGTVRGYAYDLLNFSRFLAGQGARLTDVVATDLFDYLDWQQQQRRRVGGKVVRLARTGPAAATMNRRVSAVRGLFEHQVMVGAMAENPVPAARRANGLRTPARGLLAMSVRDGPAGAAGWSARLTGCLRASTGTMSRPSSRTC